MYSFLKTKSNSSILKHEATNCFLYQFSPKSPNENKQCHFDLHVHIHVHVHLKTKLPLLTLHCVISSLERSSGLWAGLLILMFCICVTMTTCFAAQGLVINNSVTTKKQSFVNGLAMHSGMFRSCACLWHMFCLRTVAQWVWSMETLLNTNGWE